MKYSLDKGQKRLHVQYMRRKREEKEGVIDRNWRVREKFVPDNCRPKTDQVHMKGNMGQIRKRVQNNNKNVLILNYR